MADSKFYALAYVSALAFAVSSCSMLPQQGSSTTAAAQISPSSNGQGLVIVNPALNTQALGILQQQCASCHLSGNAGPFANVSDPATIVAEGVVIPGNAASSTLYQLISNGSMPPGGMMSSADIQTIQNWIQSGLAYAPSSQPGSQPLPPVSAPSLIPLAPTYTAISADILKPKCAICHAGANSPKSGDDDASQLDLSTYAGTMNLVQPGNAQASKLYEITQSGEMPKGGLGPLSSDELSAIATWINSGAPEN